ncbi:MAG: hypothetical protein LBV66_01850 [Elusimicrobiota bacterium]|jgi:hypothetical protein|nr:hypothetical protein [Elusimicrobiota bacterium]
MRKVKNFKINLRTKDIIRSIKRLSVNETGFPEDFDITVQKACRYYSNFIHPSVIYDAFNKDSIVSISEKDAPQKWIARSILFVTIGSLLEQECKKNMTQFGEYTETIVSSIAVDALDQSKNFVCRIISSEADNENCDISRAVEVPNEFYAGLSKVIPIDKIDISLEDDKLSPKYSLCSMVYWTPSKKKK